MATILDQQNTSHDSPDAMNSATDRISAAQQFTPSVSATVNQVILFLAKVGSPTGNLTVEIWSDTGSNLPNAIIGTGSGNVAESGLSTTPAEITFTGISAVVSSGTKYWAVLKTTSAVNASNHITYDTDFSGNPYSGGIMAISDNVPAWTSRVSRDMYFKEYYDNTTIITAGGGFFQFL